MAVLDPHDGYIVMRIVYDGAPLAGKTTSVASLARELGGAVQSPAEFDGRTLYFDWLDYRGGLLAGHKIRCQVISVPGQLTLGARRRRLLKTADAIVFVGESTRAGMQEERLYLDELSALMRTVGEPPIGVIFQANKRDLPDALPLAAIHDELDATGSRMAVVETIATQDQGVRDAFVLAIRLALDRVRELMRLGKFQRMRPAIDSSDALLAELLQAEAVERDDAAQMQAASAADSSSDPDPLQKTMAAYVMREVMRGEQVGQAKQAGASSKRRIKPADPPALPDSGVGVGLIWPPIEGRLMLQRLGAGAATLQHDTDGSWQATQQSLGQAKEQWLLHSSRWFESLEPGRQELLRWARINAECSAVMSKDRCIALAADGAGGFRLWQVVRAMPTVRVQLEQVLAAADKTAADAVSTILAGLLKWADNAAQSGHVLPTSFDSLGGTADQLLYVDMVPLPDAMPARAPSRDELLRTWLDQSRTNPALHQLLSRVVPSLSSVA